MIVRLKGSHRKEDCFELYPEKRPKSWITPTKKKGKGRGNDRERSRSKSVEKGEKSKERRDPSPYPGRTNRVTNSDRFTDRDSAEESEKEKEDEREYLAALEKAEQIKEKIEKRKGTGSARRVRTDLFAENRREEEYRDLERDWTRGASSRDPRGSVRRTRHCRRITKYSPPSGEASCALSGRSLRREGRSNNSTMFNVQERIGSQRSIMELNW